MRLPPHARAVISACALALLTCGFPPSVQDPDVNDDGVVNVLDVSFVNGCITSPATPGCAAADIDMDGSVTQADLTLVIQSFGQTGFPVNDVEQAKTLFCDAHDIAGADDELAAFLASPSAQVDPKRYQSARFLRAVTRVLRPFTEPSGDATPGVIDGIPEALDAVGIGSDGRNPLDWTASMPVNELGQCIVPDGGGRSEQVEGALRDALLPALTASLADLDEVGAGWTDACRFRVVHRSSEGSVTSIIERVELDYADALLLQVALRAARSALHFLSAYETDVDLHEVVCEIAPLHRTIQSFLEDPAFDDVGTLADDTSGLAHASQDAQAALATVPLAFDALQAEIDDPADDLVSLDPVHFTPEREALLRTQIEAGLAAFDEPTVIPEVRICGDARFDFAALFSGLDLRALLPPFTGNLPDLLSLPDPTFGGILPGGTLDDLRCTADTEPPRFDELADSLVVSPYALSLRLADEAVAGSGGHPVNPDSLTVTMSLFSGFGDCSATLDGVAAASESASADVTDLLTTNQNGDGSLTLSGELEVSASDARCFVLIEADVSDSLGNQSVDSVFLTVALAGSISHFDPPGGFVTSPFPTSVEITAPFGDIDPEDVQLSMNAFGCGAVRIGGVLIPGSDVGDLVFEDVTGFFALAAGPGPDTVTRSGTVGVTNACVLDLFTNFDSVSYFVSP